MDASFCALSGQAHLLDEFVRDPGIAVE